MQYRSHKFCDDPVTEAAHMISLDGCCETFGSVDTVGHYALVEVRLDTLVTEASHSPDFWLALVRLWKQHGKSLADPIFVIIREDEQGFVQSCYMNWVEENAADRWLEILTVLEPLLSQEEL